MPFTPKRPCRYPGCPNLCEKGNLYCADHAKNEDVQTLHARDMARGTASERGYDKRWRDARGLYLKQHPLCVKCMQAGRITPATVIDHIIPHRGNKELFWDTNNWQSLCKPCHDEKTGSGL